MNTQYRDEYQKHLADVALSPQLVERLAEEIYDCMDMFENAVDHGEWPETWHSKGVEFLAIYLIEHGWTISTDGTNR